MTVRPLLQNVPVFEGSTPSDPVVVNVSVGLTLFKGGTYYVGVHDLFMIHQIRNNSLKSS